jgi:hypothetical protein
VVVALGTQQEMHMRLILSSVACPAVLYFTTLSHKRHDFLLKEYKIVLQISLSLSSETLLILRRI